MKFLQLLSRVKVFRSLRAPLPTRLSRYNINHISPISLREPKTSDNYIIIPIEMQSLGHYDFSGCATIHGHNGTPGMTQTVLQGVTESQSPSLKFPLITIFSPRSACKVDQRS